MGANYLEFEWLAPERGLAAVCPRRVKGINFAVNAFGSIHGHMSVMFFSPSLSDMMTPHDPLLWGGGARAINPESITVLKSVHAY